MANVNTASPVANALGRSPGLTRPVEQHNLFQNSQRQDSDSPRVYGPEPKPSHQRTGIDSRANANAGVANDRMEFLSGIREARGESTVAPSNEIIEVLNSFDISIFETALCSQFLNEGIPRVFSVLLGQMAKHMAWYKTLRTKLHKACGDKVGVYLQNEIQNFTTSFMSSSACSPFTAVCATISRV